MNGAADIDGPALQPRDQLAAAVEELPHAVALFDTADRLVLWNRAYAEVSRESRHLLKRGTRLETLVMAGLTTGALDVPEHERSAYFARRMAFHRNPTGIFERRLADGTWQEVREYSIPGGSRMMMLSDITVRKQAEESLRRSEHRLSLHLEQTPIGSIEWDTEFRVIAWNRAAERIFGYSREEMIGRPSRGLIVSERVRTDLDPALRKLLHGQGGARSTNENIRKDGTIIVCDWYNTPLIDSDGAVIGIAALVQDITDRIRSEAELRDAKEAAETSDRAKSEFLANISHELRTPLNAIIGFSEVIAAGLMGPVAPRYAEYARDIHGSGIHLLQIINDLLDISKIEAGQFELHEGIVSIHAVVADCLRLVQDRAARGSVTCTASVPADFVRARADERAVKQILLNLLSNAVKFTPVSGAVRVAARREPDGGIAVAVADSGIGMRPEDIPRAMAPFSQIESQLSRRYEGTGLGLPLANKLVALHGGRLDVCSQLGAGTTVTVWLPPERVVPEVAAAVTGARRTPSR